MSLKGELHADVHAALDALGPWFSKKFENHCHMVALYTVWCNFVKMHKTLKMTPAMAAGVSDRLWCG